MMFHTTLFKTVTRAGLSLRNVTNFRSAHARRVRNLYEVLKLKPNCTGRDIKRAYIDLSKKYHPDRNNNVDSQLFLEVAEAYSILSKEDLRRDYDSSMFLKPKMKKNMYYNLNSSRRKQRNPMDDPSFYQNRDKSKDHYYQSQPYYGIKGLNRMSNSTILVASLLLMAVGVTVQILAIRHSVSFSREDLMFKSSLAAHHLEETRQNAEQNGNQLQLAILEEKFRALE